MMYDDIAPYYDELHGTEQERKIRYIAPLLTGTILDIGAGTGILAEYTDTDITGIEPSKEMIAQAEERDITMIHGPATVIQTVEQNTYDTCVCLTAAHHFKKPLEVYEHVKRVVKPEGYVIFSFLQPTPVQEPFETMFTVEENVRIQRDVIVIATNTDY